MTDARERIAEIFKSTLEFDGVIYNADQTIDAILSALPSIVREMIPDLEWKWNGASYEAASSLGEYRVAKTQNRSNDKYMVTIVTTYQASSITIGYIDGEGDAKKAANEHHKQQILKAMGMSE